MTIINKHIPIYQIRHPFPNVYGHGFFVTPIKHLTPKHIGSFKLLSARRPLFSLSQLFISPLSLVSLSSFTFIFHCSIDVLSFISPFFLLLSFSFLIFVSLLFLVALFLVFRFHISSLSYCYLLSLTLIFLSFIFCSLVSSLSCCSFFHLSFSFLLSFAILFFHLFFVFFCDECVNI